MLLETPDSGATALDGDAGNPHYRPRTSVGSSEISALHRRISEAADGRSAADTFGRPARNLDISYAPLVTMMEQDMLLIAGAGTLEASNRRAVDGRRSAAGVLRIRRKVGYFLEARSNSRHLCGAGNFSS